MQLPDSELKLSPSYHVHVQAAEARKMFKRASQFFVNTRESCRIVRAGLKSEMGAEKTA